MKKDTQQPERAGDVGSTRLVGTLSPMRIAMRAWAKQWREDRARFSDTLTELNIERAKYWRDEALKRESQQAATMSPNVPAQRLPAIDA